MAFETVINVPVPCTVTVRFKPNGNGLFPLKVRLYDKNDNLYYLRELDGQTSEININIVHAGCYVCNVPVDVNKIDSLKRGGFNIEIGAKFFKLPPPIRLFILLHELGHFYYKTEWKTDMFALKYYLMMGYNESNAFYALSKVLNHSEQSVDRIKRLYETIINTKN